MNVIRKLVRQVATAAAVCLASSTIVLAQDQWPKKPVTFVLGFAPGGTGDTLTRIYAERLQAKLGQPFIVENRSGAAGMIANEYVRRKPPDGHTLLFYALPVVLAPIVSPQTQKYDALRDFTPVALIGEVASVATVQASSPFNTMGEFIDYARKNPGKVSVGTSGMGSSDHLSNARLEKLAGIKLNLIHHKGESEAALSQAGGNVEFRMGGYLSVLPLAQAGKLRILATANPTRLAALPDLPAVSETVPGFSHTPFVGFAGPAGMDPALVQRINRELNEISKSPEVARRLADSGIQVTTKTPQEFVDYVKVQMRNMAEAVKYLGIKPE